jgi:4-amino-4-deoxy-L-arabinose transferase-like glycosyltransferase
MNRTAMRLAILFAIAVRLVVFSIVALHPERAMSPDSPLYVELGRHFADAYVTNDSAYHSTSVLRTPGYPLFCYLWFRVLGDSVTSILVAQNVVSLVSVFVVFVLTRRLVGRTAAGWAAVLVSMDPLAITYANMIRNEVFFSAVLALAALQWHRSLGQTRLAGVAAAGLLFGLATLVRPITTYLILFLLPADVYLRRNRQLSAAMSVWLLAGFLTPVGGWIARNHEVTGQLTVSSIQAQNLLVYRAAGAIAEETGESRSAVAQRIAGSSTSQQVAIAGDPDGLDAARALTLLVEHPYGAAASTIRGLGRVLFGPGTAGLSQLLFDKSTSATRWLWLPLAGYVAVLYIGLAVGLMSVLRQRKAEALVLLGTIVLYTLLFSSGPEAYSRFRAPLVPLASVVAGLGLAMLTSRHATTVPSR